MIRTACAADAQALAALNAAFNGKGLTTPEEIAKALCDNPAEVVIVAEEGETLAGFLCAQIKKSICYREASVEITELYVAPPCRARGVGRALLNAIENYAKQRMAVCSLTLLTGADNRAALALYKSAGFLPDGETHLRKDL